MEQKKKKKKKRTERLDFINEEIQKEHHAAQTFDDVDQAMKQYYYITGKPLSSDCSSYVELVEQQLHYPNPN